MSHFVSKRPIWLGDAAKPEVALPPAIQRVAAAPRWHLPSHAVILRETIREHE